MRGVQVQSGRQASKASPIFVDKEHKLEHTSRCVVQQQDTHNTASSEACRILARIRVPGERTVNIQQKTWKTYIMTSAVIIGTQTHVGRCTYIKFQQILRNDPEREDGDQNERQKLPSWPEIQSEIDLNSVSDP